MSADDLGVQPGCLFRILAIADPSYQCVNMPGILNNSVFVYPVCCVTCVYVLIGFCRLPINEHHLLTKIV